MRAFALLVLCSALAACTGIQVKPQFINANEQQFALWQQHRDQINAHKDSWQLSGRFGASMENDAWSGSIWWQQQLANYSIQLAGPLNQGAILLRGDDKNALLDMGSGSKHHNGNAETLLSRYIGWHIPFDGLRFWVLGLPQPLGDTQKVTLDEEGRINHIRHPHWDVKFQQYTQRGDVFLPRKIVLSNSEIRIRLVLDQWKFDE
ncbi:MAG: lipoprotein insertase outer membrane protein LolB [Gammaproteobacteria bacterium]|nr:lipoprotein insertase outer membrane protein LolB [Gammaproteobacteria bacterium]